MRSVGAIATALLLAISVRVNAQAPPSAAPAASAAPRPSGSQQQRLVPGMARYTDEVLFGDIYMRPRSHRAIAAWSPSRCSGNLTPVSRVGEVVGAVRPVGRSSPSSAYGQAAEGLHSNPIRDDRVCSNSSIGLSSGSSR